MDPLIRGFEMDKLQRKDTDNKRPKDLYEIGIEKSSLRRPTWRNK